MNRSEDTAPQGEGQGQSGSDGPRSSRRRRPSRFSLALIIVAVVLSASAIAVITYTRSSMASGTAGAPHTPTTMSLTAAGSSADAVAVQPIAKTVTVTPSPSTTVRPSTAPSAGTSTASSDTPDMATLYGEVQSGVVRIESMGCADGGVGTGFLISPTLVATVEHVVDDAVTIDLISGERHIAGTVVGSDPIRDLALVRASEPIVGYHFHFSATPSSVGDPVIAIGFPLGGPKTLSHGVVSGTDRQADIDGVSRSGMTQTDAPLNPGNSGGPLLDPHGAVVGLVDAGDPDANGIALAVPAAQAAPAVHEWAGSPDNQAPADCDSPQGQPPQDETVPAPSAASNPPVTGDLGLDVPMSQPACDGSVAVFLKASTTPGKYQSEVSAALRRYPGSQYLRTDQSCPSLAQSVNGNPIYAVYFLTTEDQACEVIANAHTLGAGDAYGRRLDYTSPAASQIRC